MLKVFLVEDEVTVREGLRDNIPWEEYGFQFVGEASDGEMALPMIRKDIPDVLITDIRMPFMDGLTLCHILGQEFPKMKMIIMSGYDDFEYARRAIQEGVDQYLSKPITRRTIKKALDEVKHKIDYEREQQDYQEKYQLESREYEQYQRRAFLEALFERRLSVEKMYEEAARLRIGVNAACYNLLLFSLNDRRKEESEEFRYCQNEILAFFLRFPEYIVSKWSLSSYCVIIRGEADIVHDFTERGIAEVKKIADNPRCPMQWYIAAGEPVDRFSQLAECFEKTNHRFAERFWRPERNILRAEDASLPPSDEKRSIDRVDAKNVDPSIITGFLRDGNVSDVTEFVHGYLESLKDVLKSKIFRSYLVLSIRFAVIRFVEKYGMDQERFLEQLPFDIHELEWGNDQIPDYVIRMLRLAFSLRDQESENKGHTVVQEALPYIEKHFMEEDISLNSVATVAGISSTYFSSMFSQEMGKTFTEYLTELRMNKAKELLQTQKLHTADVAQAIGYKDAHYFSFVFRKTQGVSPKEFRNRNAE
ncbi:MAG TPA: two-component system response regulator [Oribacterium sp.]|nr:two-component system response regulator [Oribacterium sp.]